MRARLHVPSYPLNVMNKLIISLSFLLGMIFTLKAQQTHKIYITGDATDFGWTLANPADSGLDGQDDGTFEWTGKLRQGYYFRFLTTASWDPTYTSVSDWGETVEEGSYELAYDVIQRDSQPAFKVGVGGIYKVVLDPQSLTMKLTLLERVVEADLYMIGVGSPAGWNTGEARNYKMDANSRHYTWTGPLTKAHPADNSGDGRFLFLANGSGDWWPRYTSDDISRHAQTIQPGKTYTIRRYETNAAESLPGWEDPAYVVDIPGIYTVTVDLSEDLSEGTFFIEPATLCIIGPAVSGSWSSEELSKYQFVNNNDGTLSFNGDLSLKAESQNDSGKFRFNKPGDWWPAFVPADNANADVNREGEYDIRWMPHESPAFKINIDGNFTIKLDLNGNSPRMDIHRNGNIGDNSGVESVNRGNSDIRYFNLQGFPVDHPVKGGIFIKVENGKFTKINIEN